MSTNTVLLYYFDDSIYRYIGNAKTISDEFVFDREKQNENNYETSLVNYVSNSMGLAYMGTDDRTIFDVGQHTEVHKLVKTFLLDGNGGLQIINGYNAANKFTKTQCFIGNNESINKILSKEGYVNVDLSCLPIIKGSSNIKQTQKHKKTWVFHK